MGDRVRHVKFGEGIVTSIVEGGRDYEVTVEFDTAGTKKCLQYLQNCRKYKNVQKLIPGFFRKFPGKSSSNMAQMVL